ncbi:MAG: hypothetical protein JWN83_2260 [Chitinophagaceae bacterium]|nr:hypothetical protein [Chitinophagaceae bacterium]
MTSPTTKNKITIERKDSIQIETNIQTGLVTKSKVVWTSPCEYKIIGMASNKKVKDGVDSFFSITPINVTIVTTAKNYYIFQIKMDSATKHVEYSDTIHVEK